MPKRSDHDDEMGIGTKFTFGLVLWKTTKGLVKIGAMAGATVLGWQLVSRMFDRKGSAEVEPPVVA